RRLSVSAFPLQSSAYDRCFILLCQCTGVVAPRWGDSLGSESTEGRTHEDRRIRGHVFPRHDRIFDRNAWDPSARSFPRGLRSILERGLHDHQRAVLDSRLAGVVGLVVELADLVLTGGDERWPSIRIS